MHPRAVCTVCLMPIIHQGEFSTITNGAHTLVKTAMWRESGPLCNTPTHRSMLIPVSLHSHHAYQSVTPFSPRVDHLFAFNKTYLGNFLVEHRQAVHGGHIFRCVCARVWLLRLHLDIKVLALTLILHEASPQLLILGPQWPQQVHLL